MSTGETDLSLFFHPRLTAVIGATDNPQHGNYFLFKKVLARAALDGSTVYAVNPRPGLTEIEGAPCVPAIADVPGEIDLAVLMVSKERIIEIATEVCARRPRFAIVFTAGFRETGRPEDAALEEQLAGICAAAGVRLFGPNTNVNCLEIFPSLPGPKLALVTQSGHQGRPIADGVKLGVGVKSWVPTGNEADLEAADFIEHFVGDDDVAVVAAYIEGFKNADRLRRAAEKAAKAAKPIVLVKIGRTEAGARMAASHTGHLTGSDAVHDAFFRQFGIVRVDDLDELLETSAMFTRLPRPPGDGVCIYGISGGTGTHMADIASHAGLRIPTLTDETQQRLHELGIPDYLTVANPVDNGAQPVRRPGVNRALMEACLDDPNVDILVCPITGVLPSMSTIVADDIVDAHRSAKKPVIVIWGSPITDDEGYRILIEGRVPMFRSFKGCAAGIKRYLDYWSFQERFDPVPVTPARIPAGLETMLAHTGTLSEADSAMIASQYGVRFPRTALVTSTADATAAAAKLEGPVVMKACGSGIAHKSDLGLVRLGVAQTDAARIFAELEDAARAHAGDAGYDGVLVQETAPSGEEVIVGVSHDRQFGPVVLFGLGGIFVEILRDVSMRVAPISRRDAYEMIHEVRGYPLLAGARGRPAADVEAVADLLCNVSRLAMDLRDRPRELDLNPVRVLAAGQGVIALDALLVTS
ncbi:MAG TPA: acetate--CoA ligase family protein [Actinomycetota bacterium]|nr:acetate--CoA ligase family protein [Actinomycetota bacterium]